MDQARYNRAIEAAQLKSDLKLLKGGDLCEIGDRGITLSGGQMQRLAIARALYLQWARLSGTRAGPPCYCKYERPARSAR